MHIILNGKTGILIKAAFTHLKIHHLLPISLLLLCARAVNIELNVLLITSKLQINHTEHYQNKIFIYLTSDLLTVLPLLQSVLVAASAVPESSAVADQPHSLAGHLLLQIWNNLRKRNCKSKALKCRYKHSKMHTIWNTIMCNLRCKTPPFITRSWVISLFQS